jgi:hypothetical protein
MTVFVPGLPDDADVPTCIDNALAQLCDVITRRDLPHDVRILLCSVAGALSAVLAHKDQARARIKKCQVRRRRWRA